MSTVLTRNVALGLALAAVWCAIGCTGTPSPPQNDNSSENRNANDDDPGNTNGNQNDNGKDEPETSDGRAIFRFDTFGSEAHWGDALKLHLSIAGEANGGVGPGLTPAMALELGLKVDSDALSAGLIRALQNGEVDLEDAATTLTLLQADAVVGVKGFFDGDGRLARVGIQCALCHSTVDDAVLPGIGRRLDGWANRDLNVGAITAFSADLQPLADALQVDVPTVVAVLNAWGPGKFDAQLPLDGKGFGPDGRTAATLIPPAFGLMGINSHTWTGSWGTIPYWNAFVANIEMHGQGNFFDPRLNDPVKYPLAVANGLFDIRNEVDLITAKLPALHEYQLSLSPPPPPVGSFDEQAAARGEILFATGGKADCARCHMPPLFTESGWNLHTAEELGIDDFQASRSPDGRYRTAPLRGLWTHAKGGFYHDGRFATLLDVVNHYDTVLEIGLTDDEKMDLVEFLKSL
jgi:hypothetical protein